MTAMLEVPAIRLAAPRDAHAIAALCARAEARLERLTSEGWNGAQLYGAEPGDGVGGFGAFFLLLDDPEVYGLPPDPVVPTRHLRRLWRTTALAAVGLLAGVTIAFAGGRE